MRANHFSVFAASALCCIVILMQLPLDAQTNTVFFGPTPYLDFNGAKPGVGMNYSPFAEILFTYFYLETFEEMALTVPGVAASSGITASPQPYEDSVDGDDGVIDGYGYSGYSWYSQSTKVTFTFDKDILGGFPTHAGIVWTDVGFDGHGGYGYGNVIFEAFGSDSNSLGVIGPFWLGDGLATGETPEDRFFGVSDSRGISAISITMPDSTDWGLDHLQYGREAAIVGGASASIKLLPTNSPAVQVSWPSQSNALYQVQWTTHLGTGSNVWRTLSLWNLDADTNVERNIGAAIVGDGSTKAVSDFIEGREQGFYRVILIQ
jgi:hypothetical protein